MSNFKYIIDSFERCFKYLIDHSKLSLMKFKVLAVFSITALLTYNYFLKGSSKEGTLEFEVNSQEVPISSVLLIVISFLFCIIADVAENHLRRNKMQAMLLDDRLASSLKERILEEYLKVK